MQLGSVFFIYAILGAVGAREPSSEYDYTDNYVTDAYLHAGVHSRLILNTY
jgi:hypothetical protein